MTAIQMKCSSKILKRRIVFKKLDFNVLSGGDDEIRILSMVFSDEIIPPQTVSFLWKIKINFSFLVTFQLFQSLSRIVIYILAKYGQNVYLKNYKRPLKLFFKKIGK